ncbi:uncharacterized protein [Typha latifolia]|uniref:uncharacterized protein isoform X2 n=1 Tax=Typha latifolia TaxID=4733 RepID=UPI003C2EA000
MAMEQSGAVRCQKIGCVDGSCRYHKSAAREEKKLRRVLANREAARQTILRRQALREELVRKVADLSLENENLKMEKERAIKEHLLLRDTNRQLREEVVRASKPDNENSEEEAPTTSSATLPLLIYSAPAATVPSVRQSWSTYYEQGDGGASCPWIFPLTSVPGSCTANEEPNDEQHSSRDSQRTYDNEEKEEAVSCSLTLNTRVSQQVSNSKRRILQPCPNKALPISSCLADVPGNEVEPQGASHGTSVDAAAATSAAARKRRKEVRELKQGCRGLSIFV